MLVAPLRNAGPEKVHYYGLSRSCKVNQCVSLKEVNETSARAAYKEQTRASQPFSSCYVLSTAPGYCLSCNCSGLGVQRGHTCP